MALRPVVLVAFMVACWLCGAALGRRIVQQPSDWIGPSMAFYPKNIKMWGEASRAYVLYNTGEKGAYTFRQRRSGRGQVVDLTYKVNKNGKQVMLKKKEYTLNLANSADFASQRYKFMNYIRGIIREDNEKYSKEKGVERKSVEVLNVLYYRAYQKNGAWYAKFTGKIYLDGSHKKTFEKEYELKDATADEFLQCLAEYKKLLEAENKAQVDVQTGPDWLIKAPSAPEVVPETKPAEAPKPAPATPHLRRFRFRYSRQSDGTIKLSARCYLLDGKKVVRTVYRSYIIRSRAERSAKIAEFRKTAC